MTDLTAITTPFGLLDRETQEALKAHGGPYEAFTAHGTWGTWAPPAIYPWYVHMAYRVKHAPPKPREFWLTVDPRGARWFSMSPVAEDGYHEIIHVREVLE